MENTFVNPCKDGRDKGDSSDGLSKDTELLGDLSLDCDPGLDCSELKPRTLMRQVNSQCGLILSVKLLLTPKSCLFFQSSLGLDIKIPKHMVTLDERYLRRCLELIHISASKAVQCNVSVNLGSAEVGILWDDMNSAKIWNENVFDFGRFFVSESSTVGLIVCSQSLINILKSPLLNKFGALDGDGNFSRINSNDVKGSINNDYISSPGEFSSYSSQKQDKETLMLRNHKRGSNTDPKRLAFSSSSNSTCSDQSSSSASVSMGMLQCVWKGENPYFVFSIDERKEVYVANLSKIDSIDDKALDCMYAFHWRKSGSHKQLEICDDETSLLVGKMKVSTYFTLCPNNSMIMQTEYTLFGSSEDFVGVMKKNEGLSKRVEKVFRTSNSWKQRSLSKFRGSSAILENSDALGGSSLFEDHHLPPNLELAAIVVKDHLPESHHWKEVGGWGMKFLKKVSVETLKTSAASACCSRDMGDCSTSMDVVIPAGFHGGPRTRNGGPSGLVERWRSGGSCDCGGWDLGCPLTRISKKGFLRPANKSTEFFIQGSEEEAAPTMRMVNVDDGGLYIIHFQSTLSALQSLSIAVASIHYQSPILRPKNVTVHELN